MNIDQATQAALAAQAQAEQQKAQEQAVQTGSGALDAIGVAFDVAAEFATDAAIGTAKVAGECVIACISAIGDAF